ncbi:MAG TPA: hypothetical protein VMB74_10150 [Streptosporangiaceae bacterium]|nr:hypothetical protein [Streptosporangiaceae bacterium]
MTEWIDQQAVWEIVVVGLLAGAGLPALFAVGLRARRRLHPAFRPSRQSANPRMKRYGPSPVSRARIFSAIRMISSPSSAAR